MDLNEYWVEEPTNEYVHVSELEDVECAKEFLAEVVEGLYGDKPLDQMERSLEEACAYLKVPFPKKELTITKKNPYFKFGVALSKHQAGVLPRTTGGNSHE